MSKKFKSDNLTDPIIKHIRRDFVVLREDQTACEVLASLRNKEIGDKIVYLYVTDDRDKLTGVVPIRRLLMNQLDTKIASIMVPQPISIPASGTVLQACELFSKHRFLALPVIDESDRIIGVVDINLFTDEIVSLAHQQQINNAFQLIGVHLSLGRKVSSWVAFKDRFPWLMCNIGSGIVCAFIASRYELLISEVAMLAMFITVVLALAESVSIQSMTITLQVFLHQQVSRHHILAGLRKEILTSAMLGMGSGLLVGIVGFLWRGNFPQSLVVGGSICLAIVTACLLGVLVPTAIRAFRVDPKIAAGPIVLASADIATLIFYFSMAARLLS